MGLETGDLEFAAISLYSYCCSAYFMGREMTALKQEMTNYSNAISQIKQQRILYWHEIYRQTVLTLLGGVVRILVTQSMQPITKKKLFQMILENNDGVRLLYTYFLVNYSYATFLKMILQALKNAARAEQYLHGGIGKIVIPQFYFS